ncbi:MAG: sel1 repeat family protein [Clostridia bacterium]|nr:sel1 repeat family protein [Clostridia bacterium]
MTTEKFDETLVLAENGDAYAQYEIAVCYARGEWGAEQDFDKAVYWYEKSADGGELAAIYEYGLCFINGWGVERDLKKAFALIRKAADLGYGYAMFNLGTNYYDGELETDYAEAFKWFTKAAQSGDKSAEADAKAYLAMLYDDGIGVAQNRAKGFQLLNEVTAENAGHFGEIAQGLMGLHYHKGWGTAIDFKKARYWYNLAEENGNENVGEYLAELDEDERRAARGASAQSGSGVNWAVAILLLLIFFPAGIIYIIVKSGSAGGAVSTAYSSTSASAASETQSKPEPELVIYGQGFGETYTVNGYGDIVDRGGSRTGFRLRGNDILRDSDSSTVGWLHSPSSVSYANDYEGAKPFTRWEKK